MNIPKIDLAVVNDLGGVFEIAMVVDGKIIIYECARHVAAGLACRITEALAKPYFIAPLVCRAGK